VITTPGGFERRQVLGSRGTAVADTTHAHEAQARIGLDFIDQLTGGRIGVFDMPCPLCGPVKLKLASQRKPTLRIWRIDPAFATYHCARCGETGYARDRDGLSIDPVKLARARADAAERERQITAQRLDLVRWMWHRRQPIIGSIGEAYLRDARGYRGPLPSTLGFLPAWSKHPPAVIAVFGMAREIAPGEIAIDDDAVLGAHLIKLKTDGSDRLREEEAKVTIGRGFTAPIVLLPPNDLLALTIAEGVEDALSDYQISGAGAWAAASAGRMPGLAALVPNYIESVTILVDNNDAGRSCSHALAAALHARDIEVLLAGAPS
jgi:hypothetical protein